MPDDIPFDPETGLPDEETAVAVRGRRLRPSPTRRGIAVPQTERRQLGRTAVLRFEGAEAERQAGLGLGLVVEGEADRTFYLKMLNDGANPVFATIYFTATRLFGRISRRVSRMVGSLNDADATIRISQ